MYNSSESFRKAAVSMDRTIRIKAIVNSSELLTGADFIVSLTFEETMESSKGLSMGCTGSNKIKMEIRTPEKSIAFMRGTISPSVGFVLPDGTEEYVPLGKFYVSSVNTSDDFKTMTLEAYDGMSRTEDEYVTTIQEWPAAADAVLDDISQQCGITLAEIDWPDEIPMLSSYKDGTCKEYIGWIAGLLGKNAKFDRDGNLDFAYYKSVEYLVGRTAQYKNGLKITSEENTTIASLISGTTSSPITAGTGSGISFENPYMTEDILNGILYNVNNITFRPSTCKWRGDPSVETGDIILAETSDGTMINVLVMSRQLVISGGLYDTISCYAQSEKTYAVSSSPTDKKIQKVYAALTQAIIDASFLINGAKGGIFIVTDSDNDGINDGFILADNADLSAAKELVRGTYKGIGLSDNGGETYKEAITGKGINADAITVGQMSAEHIQVNGNTLSDYLDISIDEDGHPIMRIGASGSDITMTLTNNQQTYFQGGVPVSYINDRVSHFTDGEFLYSLKVGKFSWKPRENGNLSLRKVED